ncbi:cache domain-containing protein [Arcobacter arenosus]|uniref:histidine kinase n=1 Tax=Arcobacter arenosus TaxID=2576037 RepID=A0A5R8Y117_9BACT|nr:cache domain-containing protein [Arcobacter arenosus]TLP38476.1 histidine kinase [Arcobacter arenosus]
MKITNDEKNILNIIKFSPIILVILVSLFVSNIYLTKMEEAFTKEIKLTKQKYLIENKQIIKSKIDNIYNLITYEKDKSEQLLKAQIKNRVYEAHAIATNIYEETKDYINKEELLSIIKKVLGSIKYNNGRGYFFIDDVNGIGILQPLNKSLENKNKLEFKDAKGYQFVKTIVQTIKDKSERYDTYYWFKPNNNKDTYKKISFYKYFEPLNVAIGTGEYIDDFENDLKIELLLKIKKIKAENNSYIFIFDDKGTVLSHYKDSLVGTNRYNIKNNLGKYVIKDVINFAKENKKGFMRYITEVNPENLEKQDKISYIRFVDNWNWVIGTGFFLEKFNKEIEQKTKNLLSSKEKSIREIILLSIFITAVFILLSFYISRKISQKFIIYRSKIEDENNKAIEKERLLIQQSKMAAMGEMIGNIAHQWRQPLSAISATATGLKIQKELDCLSPDEIDSSLTAINNSVQYLSKTIDDFRGFLNPNNKDRKNFMISDSVDKALNLVSSQFAAKEIEVIKDIEEYELFSIENELVQVLINIFNNSKDILISKENQKRLIFIKTYKKNNSFYIEIKDNGGGIKDSIIERIFEPYFTTKHQSQGTGIGLYMSQEIVRNHLNGTLMVENVTYIYKDIEYTGAKFTIEIIIV